MARGAVTCLIIFVVICGFLNVKGQKDIILLNEDNWTDMLKDEWMVEFYAPWCPACKGLQDTWRQFASWGLDMGIKVGQVDVTSSPGLSGRFMVTALPTIFHVLNGEFRQYKGSRDKESFMSFVVEKKWQQVEPVPYWKSPNSIQMSIVSTFFKLSQTLRLIHTKLMDDFGLPTWGSYLIFAIATIIMGALLGLVLVCLIDLIYPPKQTVVVSKEKKKAKESDDELGDEDIKDDLLDDAEGSDKDKNKSSPSSPNAKKRKPRRAD
ncbi:thioredoxin-related transmembrane protein 1 [Tribolium castaneum]|uniref:Thioredoxin-related transmembrane protein 1 n=1 Tax=Tribolium castaneum TaxID=7070 RepID=D6WIH6_TRICA|nr:PREDICTED: thioredoxin-related transmembrane protein 1 [Tribolium castaneum]EEZ99667.1 Thioredoxin-related transmembrane protein 1-like Protein [Tribolium castaneum]|eukprot:XP_008191501.1 PREDICTED: thioredoxin-related transmembrane protein 1 [Tribolium castaneum]